MSIRFSFALTCLLTMVIFIGCEKSDYLTEEHTDIAEKKGDNPGKGKGKPSGGNEEPEPSVTYSATYLLYMADDPDPLYKFSIATSGDLMLLQTDPSVTGWGTDYYGYWSDPFPFAGNEVNYTFGLANTTYTFIPLPDNKYQVEKTIVQQPYLGSTVTTTVSTPGIYIKVQ